MMGSAVDSDLSLGGVVLLDSVLCFFGGGLMLATAALATEKPPVPLLPLFVGGLASIILSRKEQNKTVQHIQILGSGFATTSCCWMIMCSLSVIVENV